VSGELAQSGFLRSEADPGTGECVSEGTPFDTAGSTDPAVDVIGFRRRDLRTLLSRYKVAVDVVDGAALTTEGAMESVSFGNVLFHAVMDVAE
jgi:hypothetical protein